MEKMASLVVGLILSAPAMAIGMYDGIWSMTVQTKTGPTVVGYVSYHENMNVATFGAYPVLAMIISPGQPAQPLQGTRKVGAGLGAPLTLTSIPGFANYSITVDVVFSPTTLTDYTATVTSCAPVNTCNIPGGTKITGSKIF